MPDLAHFFGQDLALGPTGDLALVSGSLAVEQRVLRRLLTAPGAYIWHVQYGAGLGAMVGMPANARLITGLVRQQMGLEAAVAQNPPPTVSVTSSPDGTVVANIAYVDAATGKTNVLSAPVPV
jgi:hypothetical protein